MTASLDNAFAEAELDALVSAFVVAGTIVVTGTKVNNTQGDMDHE